MIYLDASNYPVDVTLDNADSAVRIGIICTAPIEHILKLRLSSTATLITDYVIGSLGVRHPNTNPWNFTRDQLDCLVAGLYALGEHELIRKLFWAHLKRGFFCQNFDRDVLGSKKYLWPHEFFKDSKPNTVTFLKKFNFKTLRFESTVPQKVRDLYTMESRVVDWADPMFGSIWHLIKGGKMWYFYWFFIIGIPIWAFNVLVQRYAGIKSEQNQIFGQSFVNGKWGLRFYRWVNTSWDVQSARYWADRGEMEYHYIIEKVVTDA